MSTLKRTSVLKGAVILTIAGIITRLLGFVFRIYMSNVIGAEGMGLYQLVVPLYSLAWSISCSGFTTTVSKITAQEKVKKEYGNMGLVLKLSVLITTTIGSIIAFLMFFNSNLLAVTFFHDERIILSIKLLALGVPFMAAGSCFRGYFFGLQETTIPALNQVFEQSVRMIVIYLLASVFVSKGLEYACALAVIGIILSEILSFIFILIAYKFFKHKKRLFNTPSLKTYSALSMIFTMAIPLTANRVTGSLLSTVENMLIPQRLEMYGMTPDVAIGTFGKITGMAMPLVYFPTAILTSLSICLVPNLSEAVTIKNYTSVNRTLNKSILFASVIGFCATVIFVLFAKEFGQILYKQDLREMLIIFGVMCPFLYMHFIFSGALNGLGEQMLLFKNSLLSSIITILFIYFFMPIIGINAFIFGWFVSLIIICAIEINRLNKRSGIEFAFINWCVKPLLCAVLTGLVMKILSPYVFLFFNDKIGLMISVFITGIMYMMLIFSCRCIMFSEIKSLFKR